MGCNAQPRQRSVPSGGAGRHAMLQGHQKIFKSSNHRMWERKMNKSVLSHISVDQILH